MSQKKTADFGDLSRNKVVMCVGCLLNCGELFADFWRPKRLVDMKSSNSAVNDDPEMAEAASPSSHSGAKQ